MDLSNTTLQIVEADLGNDNHAATIVELLDTYARDRFGGSKPLSESTRERLIPAMRQHPTSLVLLTFDNQTAVGMATCFIGFSTFQHTRPGRGPQSSWSRHWPSVVGGGRTSSHQTRMLQADPGGSR
jgi:hypothetical protein